MIPAETLTAAMARVRDQDAARRVEQTNARYHQLHICDILLIHLSNDIEARITAALETNNDPCFPIVVTRDSIRVELLPAPDPAKGKDNPYLTEYRMKVDKIMATHQPYTRERVWVLVSTLLGQHWKCEDTGSKIVIAYPQFVTST